LTLSRGDNAGALTSRIGWSPTAAPGNAECCQAVSVEARDQIGHGRATVQAGFARRVDKHTGPRHRQQRSGPTHLVDTFAATLGDAL